MWGSHEGMGWWWIFGSVWMVVFWAAIIGLIVWIIKQRPASRRDTDRTPLEIAQMRLTRGEISPEQFDTLKKSLE